MTEFESSQVNDVKEEVGVRVFCRFRPPETQSELAESATDTGDGEWLCEHYRIDQKSSSVTFIGNSLSALPNSTWTFDHILPPSITQEEVYNLSTKPIVDAVLQGYNGTVFAYGQTSTGKTHTIEGLNIEDPDSQGIIPRALKQVLDYVHSHGMSQFSDSNTEYELSGGSVEFDLKVSMVEIYMERIRDLLDPNKDNLVVREDTIRGVWVEDAMEVVVRDLSDVMHVLHAGQSNRAMAETRMNEHSSRSHSVFTLHVTIRNLVDMSQRVGKLVLVDLAGSEKVQKTGAAGKTLEEAKTINKSLHALGNVINALTDQKVTHIPYRDSKLTRVLQESLGGNSRTALIIHCSLLNQHEAETLSTLRFGTRAKYIKNKPRINHDYSVEELKRLYSSAQQKVREQHVLICALKQQLATYEGSKMETPKRSLRPKSTGPNGHIRRHSLFPGDPSSPSKFLYRQTSEGSRTNLAKLDRRRVSSASKARQFESPVHSDSLEESRRPSNIGVGIQVMRKSPVPESEQTNLPLESNGNGLTRVADFYENEENKENEEVSHLVEMAVIREGNESENSTLNVPKNEHFECQTVVSASQDFLKPKLSPLDNSILIPEYWENSSDSASNLSPTAPRDFTETNSNSNSHNLAFSLAETFARCQTPPSHPLPETDKIRQFSPLTRKIDFDESLKYGSEENEFNQGTPTTACNVDVIESFDCNTKVLCAVKLALEDLLKVQISDLTDALHKENDILEQIKELLFRVMTAFNFDFSSNRLILRGHQDVQFPQNIDPFQSNQSDNRTDPFFLNARALTSINGLTNVKYDSNVQNSVGSHTELAESKKEPRYSPTKVQTFQLDAKSDASTVQLDDSMHDFVQDAEFSVEQFSPVKEKRSLFESMVEGAKSFIRRSSWQTDNSSKSEKSDESKSDVSIRAHISDREKDPRATDKELIHLRETLVKLRQKLRQREAQLLLARKELKMLLSREKIRRIEISEKVGQLRDQLFRFLDLLIPFEDQNIDPSSIPLTQYLNTPEKLVLKHSTESNYQNSIHKIEKPSTKAQQKGSLDSTGILSFVSSLFSSREEDSSDTQSQEENFEFKGTNKLKQAHSDTEGHDRLVLFVFTVDELKMTYSKLLDMISQLKLYVATPYSDLMSVMNPSILDNDCVPSPRSSVSPRKPLMHPRHTQLSFRTRSHEKNEKIKSNPLISKLYFRRGQEQDQDQDQGAFSEYYSYGNSPRSPSRGRASSLIVLQAQESIEQTSSMSSQCSISSNPSTHQFDHHINHNVSPVSLSTSLSLGLPKPVSPSQNQDEKSSNLTGILNQTRPQVYKISESKHLANRSQSFDMGDTFDAIPVAREDLDLEFSVLINKMRRNDKLDQIGVDVSRDLELI